MTQLAFYVDLSACTGCKACQVACMDKNDLPADVNWRRVLEYSGGEWANRDDFIIPVDIFAYYISSACMHCENPLCVTVCPTTAISKNDRGIVIIDPRKCIGCRYCQWACPYGAPQFNFQMGVMTKCDFCIDLLTNGGIPVCVSSCPNRALDFGTLKELKNQHGDFSDPAPLPDPRMTKPSIVFGQNNITRRKGDIEGDIVNVEEITR